MPIAAAALAPRLREHYRSKRAVMETALRAELGGKLTWPAPKGGFFLWATLPDELDTTDLTLSNGVIRDSQIAGLDLNGAGGGPSRSFPAASPR